MFKVELWLNNNYYKTITFTAYPSTYQEAVRNSVELSKVPQSSQIWYHPIIEFIPIQESGDDGPMMVCNNPNLRIGNGYIYELPKKREEKSPFKKKVKAKRDKIGSRFDILDL